MELFLLSSVFLAVTTAVVAIDEHFDWMDSYRRAAAEDHEERALTYQQLTEKGYQE
jgi:hypothetical protein